MNAALDWNLWQPFFSTLAVGTVLVVAIALLLQRWTLSMAWRRTIWQVAFLGLGLLAITEISGASRAAWSWLPRRSAPEPDGQLLMESKVIGEPDLRMLLAQRLQAGNVQAVRSIPDNSPAEEPVRWPGAIWLLGFVTAIGWMVLARVVFLIFVPRRRVRDECLLARVNSIARRLGGLRRVRVGETPCLAGPIAFGILRPGISLPEGFTSRFTDEQQDAMLAHELAHLAARDPLWHALADLVTAMLWWHPLAWLAKQQLRAASEAAADEASLIVENGPNVLAECLVELGGRLTRTHCLGWLGMAGGDFRSGLGRRVKRLLSLSAQPWRPMRRSRVWLVRIVVPLTLVALVLAVAVWANPPLEGPGTLRQALQRSILGLALAAALPQAPTVPPETDHIDWQPWSPEALASARTQGKTVLVHFTADWAATAKANEQTSLEVAPVRAKLRELGAVALRGDYTQDDEAIANELLAFGRAGVPLTLVYPSDPSLPPQVLPNVLTPQIVLDALEHGIAGSEKQASKIASDSTNSDKNKAPALILQGRSLREAGKQAEAKAKFEEALKLDPGNLAAKYYLSLLQQAANLAGTNSASETNLVQNSRGREVINQKLDSIRLKEISFPGVPLNEVVRKLATMVTVADRDGTGINLYIMTNVVIDLKLPLRDVTLRQALDAIVKCAEVPLKYGVEDYAVVISSGRAPPLLHTPQVTIEVKFAEMTEPDSKALGFDWFLRNTLTQNSGLGPQSKLFETSATKVGVPDSSVADNLFNLFQELRNHPLPALPSSIGTNAPENEPLTGILTDPQYRVVIRALEQRQGVNILTLPKVTTLSGRQAQVKTVNVRYVVTDLDFSQIVSNATTGALNGIQPKPIAEQFELGPMLDVVPYVQADGHTIQMTVIPTFREFLGYDVKQARLVPPEAKSADMQQLTPLPVFRLRQIVSSVTVSDGQTVMLAGGSDRLLANPNKNLPLREGTKPPREPKKTKLVIFVTATLIDPAGNRIHPAEETPPRLPARESTP